MYLTKHWICVWSIWQNEEIIRYVICCCEFDIWDTMFLGIICLKLGLTQDAFELQGT